MIEGKRGTVPGKTQRSVYIPDELLRQFKALARRRGYKVNTLIVMAMEQYIDAAPTQPQPPSDDEPAGFD